MKFREFKQDSALKRIDELMKGKENFLKLSRNLAKNAQHRESVTIQPKESLSEEKGIITIKNYLGGYYFLTIDEVYIKENNLCLVEGKHSKSNVLPSIDDIKDGLVKMILFSNLKDVEINNKRMKYKPVLKLTSNKRFKLENLSNRKIKLLTKLKEEARKNKFYILINDKYLDDII